MNQRRSASPRMISRKIGSQGADALADGLHNLTARVQIIDPATPTKRGFGDRSDALQIIVDTVPPPVMFGFGPFGGTGLAPDSDTGVITEPETFKRALESVADGQVVFQHRLGRALASGVSPASGAELLARQLTSREIEVLQLLAEGASSTEIARRLAVSPNTVRTHVQGILTKLQVHSRREAAAFAVRYGIVKVHAPAPY